MVSSTIETGSLFLNEIYNNAVYTMKSANSENSFKSAEEMFKTISGFKDADSLAMQCFESAEVCRKDVLDFFGVLRV